MVNPRTRLRRCSFARNKREEELDSEQGSVGGVGLQVSSKVATVCLEYVRCCRVEQVGGRCIIDGEQGSVGVGLQVSSKVATRLLVVRVEYL